MKLCDTPPTHCAACFGQYTERRHVDLEAAWDGPTFDSGVATDHGVVRNLTVAIDDLILCENCLRDAGRLVDLEDAAELKAEVEKRDEQLENLRARLAESEQYADRLEQSVAAKPERRKPKRAPRQAVEA